MNSQSSVYINLKFFLMLMVFVGFVGMTSVQAFDSCVENPDWPSAPCHDGGLIIEQMQEYWDPYYKYKGTHWMEQKEYEMNVAIQNNSLLDWISLTEDTQANRNVHKYYYAKGQAPDLNGKFLPVCNMYKDLSRYHEILQDDVVLKKFLFMYPDATSSHDEIDESSPPQTTIIYQHDTADHSVSLYIPAFEGSDTELCLESFSYTINYRDGLTDSQIRNYHDDTTDLLQFLGIIPTDYVQANYFLNPEFETYAMTLNDDLEFLIPYKTFDARVGQIAVDCDSSLLILHMEDVRENGRIVLNIPRTLVDSKMGNRDDSFRVILDGIRLESTRQTYTDASSRTLHVNLEPSSKTLEIYGVYPGQYPANESVSCVQGDPDYHRFASPLKQLDLGIPYSEIQCRDALILVTKQDGSPACIKPETIPRLMERNWIKDDTKQQCETFSGIWNKDFATCFDFSDEYDCKDMGGKPVSRSYTGEQPDYSKKSDSFACEFRK